MLYIVWTIDGVQPINKCLWWKELKGQWAIVSEDLCKSKTDTTKTKHNPEKANNTKHSKTKLAWFSRYLRHSASKRGGLILQHSRAHMGLCR